MADDLQSSGPDAAQPTDERLGDREESSPGALLRAARLAKKLETKEIAATLNVDPWMLDALEHDEYAALGAPVFAKGHLRKYAAALGIDDGDVLVAYYQREGVREQPPLIAESILRVEAERGRGLGWLAPALGVLALSAIALALFFYFQPNDGPGTTRAASAQTEAVTTDTTGERSQRLRLPQASATDDASSSATEPAAPDISDVPVGTGQTVATEPAAPPPQNSAPAAAPEPSEPEPRRVSRTRPAPATATPAAAAPQRPAGPADPVRVTLDFSGDSWVEIYDASRRKLIYDMGRAGSRRSVTGDGPLQVFLGKASDVRVRVNGEPYAVERITRLGTARFYVDHNAR